MSDSFHESAPVHFVDEVFDLMRETSRPTYQVKLANSGSGYGAALSMSQY